MSDRAINEPLIPQSLCDHPQKPVSRQEWFGIHDEMWTCPDCGGTFVDPFDQTAPMPDTDRNGAQSAAEPEGGDESIPLPTRPSPGVLDFPEMGIRWPVPAEVLDGVVGAIQNAQREGRDQGIAEAFGRVQQIHVPSAPGEGHYCVECGRRSEYPCDTLLAVLGMTREEVSNNMTEQQQPQNPDVPDTMPEPEEPEVVPNEPEDRSDLIIESKEGNTVHEMKGGEAK